MEGHTPMETDVGDTVEEMNVDMPVANGTSNQDVFATGTYLTTGSGHVGTTETWIQHHIDTAQRATNAENISGTAITQQPLKSPPPSYAAHIEQHQPSSGQWQQSNVPQGQAGAQGASWTSGPNRTTEPPGLTADAEKFQGGQYDGAKSTTSQSNISRQSSQDLDETGMYLSGDRVKAAATPAAFSLESPSRTLDTDGPTTEAPGLSATAKEFPGGQYGGVGLPVSQPKLSRQSSQVQDEMAPGLSATATEFPGGQYGGVGLPVSQPKLSQQNSQVQDEMPSEPMPDQLPSTHQDVAAVLVQIECSATEPRWDRKQKWKIILSKALQTFVSKDLPDVTENTVTEICDVEILDTPFSAKVVLSPSSVCETLLNRKSATLKLKDMNADATVHFRSKQLVDKPPPTAATRRKYLSSVSETHEIPMLSVVVNVQKYGPLANELCRKFARYRTGSDTLTAEGTFEEVEKFYKEFSQVVGQTASSTSAMFDHSHATQMGISKEPMRVPLVQYWYLNHVHRKEMERIEEKHGVTIKAEVCVSVEETRKANSESLAVASNEFADLFLKTTEGIESVPVPSVAELVRDIQTLGEGKLMLNASAHNWSVLGPRDQVKLVQREWTQANMAGPRSERSVRDKLRNNTLREGSRWDQPKGVVMDIKDPLLSTGISISYTHWELTKNAFKKQIKDIKKKFGVDFQERNINGDVTVSAQSNGNQIANLEVNALRALMSLCQKVVMTTMSCPLQNVSHNQTEMAKTYLSDLCKQNPSLAVSDRSESSGVWVMIGPPDHLRFAISEIEKRLGAHVFDEKYKDMIGCGKNDVFLKPFVDRTAWTEAEGYGAASGGAASEGAAYDSVGQTWKVEREPEGRTWEHSAYGSSVDAVASVGVYGEDRQKLREAGRKEISEHGKHKQWEKGAGSTRGPHGRALPGGANGNGALEDDNCPICMDEFDNKEKLPCGHAFCKECLRRSVESLGASCPVCKKVFGKVEGDQPDGTMTHHIQRSALPGFKRCDTIVINYNIPSGIQSKKHPKPGRRFHGANRTAYLPDNKEGREIFALLKRAFDQRLIFTVGTSRTSGQDDCVTWNDIHHKTCIHGGPQSFGYPDENYMKRVRDELKAKGIE